MLIDCQPKALISFPTYLALGAGEQRALALTLSSNFTYGTTSQLIFFHQPTTFESVTLLPWKYFRQNKTASVPPKLLIRVPIEIPKPEKQDTFGKK
jgi:hypothetical protein